MSCSGVRVQGFDQHPFQPGRQVPQLAIHRGTLTRVKDLEARIRAFMDGGNESCRPFIWTEPVSQDLKKANRRKDLKREALVRICADDMLRCRP